MRCLLLPHYHALLSVQSRSLLVCLFVIRAIEPLDFVYFNCGMFRAKVMSWSFLFIFLPNYAFALNIILGEYGKT